VYDDVTSVALHSALRGLAARQRAIADNVANIETPGFLAGKVEFEDALRSAVASGDTAGASGAPAVVRSMRPTREDGNNVNLDEETLSNVETGLRYQLVTRAMDHQFALLRTAMRTH
jgi:flagellar basal-body rod protein FlgB